MERYSPYSGVMKAHGVLEGLYIFEYDSFKKAINEWIKDHETATATKTVATVERLHQYNYSRN